MRQCTGFVLLWLAVITYFLFGDSGLVVVCLLYLIGLAQLLSEYGNQQQKK